MSEEAYINEILNLQAENDRLRRDYLKLLKEARATIERIYQIINNQETRKNMKATKKLIGKKVIIRGDRSGVEYGTLNEVDGQTVELTNARRLWYWEGAASLSQMAMEGVKCPDECKFTVYVDSIVITDAIEIIPCTEKAIKSIEEVEIWKK